VFTLKRVKLDDEQWEDFMGHAKESGMNLEEFLADMPKVIEGYIRLDENEKYNNNMVK